MRSTKLVSLLLATALLPTAFGCGDDIIFPEAELPDPALNGVFPAKGFTDRTLRVEISGDGTAFDTASTVSFGDGITVDTVEVSSTGALFANITIAGTATAGKRDVIVTSGDSMLTLTAAFEVQNPIEVLTTANFRQGDIGNILVINHDIENPFFGDLEISFNGGLVFVDGQTEFRASATVFIDAVAGADSGEIVVTDILGSDTVVSHSGMAIPISARTPITAEFDTPFDSTLNSRTELLKLDLTSQALANIEVVGGLSLFAFMPDGTWANASIIDFDAPGVLLPAVNHHIVIFDEGELNVPPDPLTGYDYTFTIELIGLNPTILAEVEPNNDAATAQTGTETTIFNGSLADLDDVDVVKVTVAANQIIDASTTAPNGAAFPTDTVIQIFDVNGDLIDESSDLDFGEALTTDPLAAGDYFITIIPSSFYVSQGEEPVNDPYALTILVQTP